MRVAYGAALSNFERRKGSVLNRLLTTESLFPDDSKNSQVISAFKHALWNILLMRLPQLPGKMAKWHHTRPLHQQIQGFAVEPVDPVVVGSNSEDLAVICSNSVEL
jgi:hypothetical protein